MIASIASRIWLAIALALSLGSLTQAYGADQAWLTKYDEALAAAKKSGRPILADFTGSDWCGWCIRLKNEVFDTTEFKKWSAENVILLELDFPRAKEQDPAVKAKNQELMKAHGVRGFPTIIIMDEEGKKIGELGYMQGGPKVWIAEFVKQYKDQSGGK